MTQEKESFDADAEDRQAHSMTLRDLLAPVFRHRRLVAFTFCSVLLGAVLAALLSPPQYQAEMQILVKHERVDPVITSEPNSVAQLNDQRVTEQDLNDEMELIKSRDLLVKVVSACDLDQASRSFWDFLRPKPAGDENRKVAEAVRKLANDLSVEPIKNSSMIEVTYKSPDAALSARVLATLANGFLVKHSTVYRSPGSFAFFKQQADQYQKALATDERELVDLSRKEGLGAVSPEVQANLVLQKASDFEASLWQARALVTETEERVRALEHGLAVTPRRETTEDQKSDNPQLLANLKSSLTTLELKRTELLKNFQPNYRPVQQVEAQINVARSAIAAQQAEPLHQTSTGANPTYQWLDGELAKAKVNLTAYRAQAEANKRILDNYRNSAASLEQTEVAVENWQRAAKVAETDYLLYLKEAEGMHITKALDDSRIDNVAIAEAPTVPPLPISSRLPVLSLGILLAVLASLGSAFTADYVDSSFRTPDELAAFFSTPVLAAFPNNGA